MVRKKSFGSVAFDVSIVAICALLGFITLYRLAKGPTAADRAVAADSADVLITCALVLFSLYSGRGVYLDVAIISAMLGVLDTMLVGRYLEGRL